MTKTVFRWLDNNRVESNQTKQSSNYESALILDMDQLFTMPMTNDSCPVTVLDRFRHIGGEEKKQQLLLTLDRKMVEKTMFVIVFFC